jgi:type IV fimbrial biogenesis protein FimT
MSKTFAAAGVTLIELLISISLLAILLALAAPAFSALVDTIRLNAAANSMLSSFWLARSEAIKRGTRVVVCKSASGTACASSGAWEQGWLVFSDANNNAGRDPGEAILTVQPALASNLRFSGNSTVASFVSFTSLGQTAIVSGAPQAGTLTACALSAGSTEARQLVINFAGRIRTNTTTLAQCP